jgi:hypothetical protein
VSTDVSEENIVSIFRVEEISSARNQQASRWLAGSSETSVGAQRTTRRYIPEDSTLHNHRCENLKSYNVNKLSKILVVNLRTVYKIFT